MGTAFGHCVSTLVSMCGNEQQFEGSTKLILQTTTIEPWSAKSLVEERVRKQGFLQKATPLCKIPVELGFSHFVDHIPGVFFDGMTKASFLKTAKNLIVTQGHGPVDTGMDIALGNVYDSIDYDQSGFLTTGEWAGGLTIFFKGTVVEKDMAVFGLLDKNRSGELDRTELRDYLKPMIKSMTPPEAAPLLPLLFQKVNEEMFQQMDADKDGMVGLGEFKEWRSRHSVVDEISALIEALVYKVWIQKNLNAGSNGLGRNSLLNADYY
eukprot:GEMP01053129.1.p1 GENE.GEMP01053129.1~~GEMP01053129.1.p1  ORF type:complete len:266 (+),score=55.67 GEMP01053129.1:178-975(+)